MKERWILIRESFGFLKCSFSQETHRGGWVSALLPLSALPPSYSLLPQKFFFPHMAPSNPPKYKNTEDYLIVKSVPWVLSPRTQQLVQRQKLLLSLYL